MKRSTLVLAAVLLIAAAAHLYIACQDFPTLARNGYLYDDSFYAFQIARNIAQGHGPTFDGVTLTNGFQPLYVFMLVPVYMLAGGDPILPIHIALVMLSLMSIATAVFLYRIVSRYVGGGLAVFAAALWLFSPVVIRQTANGLETSLALLVCAWSVDFYLRRVRGVERASYGDLARLGGLLGLAVLARLDLVFLVFAILLDYLLVARRRERGGRETAAGAAMVAGTAFAVYSPWMVYGWLALGRLLPESGEAMRFLSMAYAPFLGTGPPELMNTGPDASFIWAHVMRAASVLKLNPVTHVFFRSMERLGTEVGATGLGIAAADVIGLVLAAAFVVWLVRRLRADEGDGPRELSFLLVFGVSLCAAYAFYVFGVFFFIRYFYPLYFVAVIYFALVLRDSLAWFSGHLRLRRFAAAAAAVYLAGHLFMAFNCCFRSIVVYHFYDVARWVEDNTDEDDTIGVFQSGTIGYLSNRRVINLDGKVNGDALDAIEAGTLPDYIQSRGVDFIIDNTEVIHRFLGDREPVAGSRCFSGASSGLPGWGGYRLKRTTSAAAPRMGGVGTDGSSRAP